MKRFKKRQPKQAGSGEGQPGYDPNLKMAVIEIERVLKRYQIGGALLLVSKTHSEYTYHLPPWSCAQFESLNGETAIRFRSHHTSYGSKDAQHQEQENTAHLLFQLRDFGGQTFLVFEQICAQLQEHLDIEHHPFSGHMSDDEAAL